jgi:hypothetical protein
MFPTVVLLANLDVIGEVDRVFHAACRSPAVRVVERLPSIHGLRVTFADAAAADHCRRQLGATAWQTWSGITLLPDGRSEVRVHTVRWPCALAASASAATTPMPLIAPVLPHRLGYSYRLVF